jgi:hypothetical protein
MNHVFGAGVLVIATLFCLLTTWKSSTNPNLFAERLGLTVANPGGVNEIRAQYAGCFLATAIVCIASLAGVLPREISFVVLGTIFGGLIFGRLTSLALNGGVAGYGPTILALYVIDAVGFALAVTAFFLNSSAKP